MLTLWRIEQTFTQATSCSRSRDSIEYQRENFSSSTPSQRRFPSKRQMVDHLGIEVPPYLVEPATVSYRLVMETLSTNPRVKIIDFGEAFFDNDRPEKLSTALTCRAP